jgi:GNAT superfamily N-acetyltransferase
MPITLHPASEFTSDQLAGLLNACYEDYVTPIRFRSGQFDFFVRAHDVLLEQSLVARDGDDLIGLALLARRGERGWISGLGVLPDHRRQGVARAMMTTVTDNARRSGITRLQLEVHSNNQPAIELYTDLGWQMGRELLVWERPDFQGPLPIHRERWVEMEPDFLLENYFDAWHEEPPCWQREKATLLRYTDIGMKAWAIVRDDGPVAYLLGFEPNEGRMPLMDVAVDPAVGYKSAGRAILQNLHLAYKTTPQLPNEPVASKLNFLFAAMSYQVVLRQNEMTLDL